MYTHIYIYIFYSETQEEDVNDRVNQAHNSLRRQCHGSGVCESFFKKPNNNCDSVYKLVEIMSD